MLCSKNKQMVNYIKIIQILKFKFLIFLRWFILLVLLLLFPFILKNKTKKKNKK